MTTGGAIHLHDARIRSNTGVGEAEGGGANLSSATGPITVERVEFTNNSTTGNLSRGGGLHLQSGHQAVIRNNVFAGNRATGAGGQGGGLYVVLVPTVSASLNMVQNLVTTNTSTHTGGGVLVTVDTGAATLNVYNNIVRDNTASLGGDDGDDLYILPGSSTVTIDNNDLGDNADTTAALSEDLVVMNAYTASGNVFADPGLDNDFHIATDSPCRDAGAAGAPSLPTTDFEGDPRTVGAGVDIGPDEYNVTTHAVTNVNELISALSSTTPSSATAASLPEGVSR